MNERWERVPVRREIRKALMDWAEWRIGDGLLSEQPSIAMDKAARQFRKDVLAEPELMTVEEYEEIRSKREAARRKREARRIRKTKIEPLPIGGTGDMDPSL